MIDLFAIGERVALSLEPQPVPDWLPPPPATPRLDEHRDKVLFLTVEALADLPLLPDDKRFITPKLACFTGRERHRLLSEYRRRWLEAAENEPVEYRKDNAGRFAANTWLRNEWKRGITR
ncbi:MAG: hypothetical protein CMI01_18410 [Oceanospirillaceae bacterium]|nr:hypothetical protein [Oceanospirillaceae bacterium]